jgi:hypothetical protein
MQSPQPTANHRNSSIALAVILLVVVVAADIVIVNFTPAPVPTSQAITNFEQSQSFKNATVNAIYTYLGYENGRVSLFHCGPAPTQATAEFAHIFWPPPTYGRVTLVFFVNSNVKHNVISVNSGLLEAQVNPSSGKIYSMSVGDGYICL